MSEEEAGILDSVLRRWQAGVDAHEPDRVAENFTDDAIFQGLHPYSVGPPGVAAYYSAQPVGMSVTYRLLETRRLADDLVLGYLTADFAFVTDRPTVHLYLCVIARRAGERWLIAHYQVTRLGADEPPAAGSEDRH